MKQRRSLRRHLLEREAELEKAITRAKAERDRNPESAWFESQLNNTRREWLAVYDVICTYYGTRTPPGGWL